MRHRQYLHPRQTLERHRSLVVMDGLAIDFLPGAGVIFDLFPCRPGLVIQHRLIVAD